MNEIIEKRIKQTCSDYVTELFLKDEPMGDFKDIAARFEEVAKKCTSSMWISVNESLPNPMEEVIAIDENGNTSLAWISPSGTWVVNKTNCISDVAFNYGKITHWMPIPKLKRDED